MSQAVATGDEVHAWTVGKLGAGGRQRRWPLQVRDVYASFGKYQRCVHLLAILPRYMSFWCFQDTYGKRNYVGVATHLPQPSHEAEQWAR